jgi:hypothetical protein
MRVGEPATEKVTPVPIIELQGVSADGKWVAAQVSISGKETRRGVIAYSSEGAPPISICGGFCLVSWTMDGKAMYTFRGPMKTMMSATLLWSGLSLDIRFQPCRATA